MNDNEAKFILRAFRPDGTDAQDPLFADALAQTKKNPPMEKWLEEEKAFDRTVAAKLREIPPPSGLRDAILAGGRVSLRPRAWWKSPLWLAVAASVALTLTVSLQLKHPTNEAQNFAEFALQDVATGHGTHTADRPQMLGLQARFAEATLPLTTHIKIDAAELRRLGCHTVKFSGQEVFEICFERDGKWFHLYAAPVGGFTTGAKVAQLLLVSKANLTATAWKDAQFTYALVTDEGADALRKLI